MKNLFWIVCVMIGFLLPVCNNVAYAAAEIKTVCKDKADKTGKVVTDKTGKVVQICRKIKVHKKVSGTKVPDAKPKPPAKKAKSKKE